MGIVNDSFHDFGYIPVFKITLNIFMEEDMMYKAESDSTIIYKEIKKAIFDLKKRKSAGPDRILNEVIKYTNPIMINSYMKIFYYSILY
jgi:hypothetical protein